MFFYRIKDPAQSFGVHGASTRFSLKNEFDAFIYKYPRLVALELKSNQGTSISFSLEANSGTNIKASQINSLKDCLRYGIKAGLLLNYRKTETTYWIDIANFLTFAENTTKKSINEKDLIEYGATVVPQTLKKVRYKYDLNFLFKNEEGGENCNGNV